MRTSIIKTTGLVKSFGSNVALNGLDLKVPKGIAGFIGRNGAGKTTTIGVLLGLLKPNRGKATVFGMDCWRDSYEIKRRSGVMHEVNAYPGNFTGKRFLQHVARIYGVVQIEQRVKDALIDVGLADARDKKIKTYSAGMFRRLGLAQALIGDPELAILDEPTANIDPLGRITLLDKIKELHKERGTSFLISTHILSDLEKVCNWLSIIDTGKIVDQGNIKDLSEKYSANIYKIEVSNPELFAEKVEQLAVVENVWVEDGKIYCKVNDADAFYGDVPKLATDLKLQLKGFQHLLGTLEEIYTKTASEK
ncbi:MAG TPA: ABC transporter ATP-binding protein [Candidatus Bathyarchaeota archaeon]|nr:ABC transporter ATP-binding protein [Candidatus Bathyarchaeota archaeon]